MPAPDQLLRGHPLYGLDRAIADYLGPCLERQFGEPFRRWRAQEDARTLAAEESGDPAHAQRVRRVLALDDTLAPAWIPLE